MSDRAKKISELTAHTNAPANNLLVVVHQPGLANSETRKITISNFFANVSAPATYNSNVTFNSNTNFNSTVKVSNTAIINTSGFWVGPTPGPYANDAAAAAANVAVGGVYYRDTGAVYVRLS